MQAQHRFCLILLLWLGFTALLIHPLFTASSESADSIHHFSKIDGLIPPPAPLSITDGIADTGPSQFMAGDIVIQLLLPESNGQIEPSTENWTPEQIARITQQVQEGLEWWKTQLPLARLNFMLEVHVVPTVYEPINHGLNEEQLWINEVLAQRGFAGSNYFDRAYTAAYQLRQQYGSDWATTIFVVNSEQNNTGRFPDGHFAYAYIGGPFMVLTSDNSAYGINRMNLVTAHELGHIFNALDQYSAAQVPCNRRSGYLGAASDNSQFENCPTHLPSIMLDPTIAYPIGAVDPSARAQIGYHDSDGNGIIDPLDTTPTLQLNATTTTQVGQRPSINGYSADIGYPSSYLPRVSLNHINRVEYRANGGPWQLAMPSDGAFDSVAEQFHFEPPLYDGVHYLEIRALNNVDAISAVSSLMVTISGIGEQPHYTIQAPELSNTATITITLESPPQTQAVQFNTEAYCTDTSWQTYNDTHTYQLNKKEDGWHTFYICFRDASGHSSLAYPQQILLDTQAPTGTVTLSTTTQVHATFKAIDEGSGVTDMELQFNENPASWQPYTQEVILPVGTTHIRVRFRDKAGNVSALLTAALQKNIYVPTIMR